MKHKRYIRRRFEEITHIHIYRNLPRGIDQFADIRDCLPNLSIEVVFDVGANVGQSTELYLENFADPEIYCFEPVEATYRQLEANLRNRDNVRAFQLALGAQKELRWMVLEGSPDMFSFERTAFRSRALLPEATLEHVTVETLDHFCKSRGIDHINYLKIDTEGNDLEVLKGGEHLLNYQQVDVVEVESGMNSQNERHVAFATLLNFLEDRDYRLFGIYEQVSEWPTKAPNLRRANPIFVSADVIKANSQLLSSTA